MLEGKGMPDRVHMLLSAPPQYSIAMGIGFLKSKSAIRVHRDVSKAKGSRYGRSFWDRGYCVSTVELDEAVIAQYIKDQEKHERIQGSNELTSN